MKKIFLLLGTSALLFACGGSTSEETEAAAETDSTEISEEDLLASTTMDPRTFGGDKHADQVFIDDKLNGIGSNEMTGSYVGEFGKNMINVQIYYAENGNAEGYSVCAGNFRPITGTYTVGEDGALNFVLEEPGDDQYDGTFEFSMNVADGIIQGEWTPFKEEGNSAKSYKLEKREYTYDPTVGDWPEASQRELTDDDVNNLSEDELATMRNEIYARHGYSFKNKEWRYFFEGMDWYMPMGIDIRDKLTDVEAINIELIYEYESYYEDYYDDYGR